MPPPNSAATERFSNTERCSNGSGIWNDRPRPARQRCSGGKVVMSRPFSTMRPRSGRSMPVMRLNRVDLPAPFGPMMPSASPRASDKSMSLATTIMPNALETDFSSSITQPCLLSRSAQQLHFPAHGDLRCLAVFDDDHVVFFAVQPPLAADQRLIGDVLRRERRYLVGAERDRTDDGIELGGADRLCEGCAIGRILCALERIDGDLEQRMHEADRLGPLLAGCLFVAFGEIGGTDAGQARLVGMTWGPPHLGRNVVSVLAERLHGRWKQQRLGDRHHLRPV